MISGATGALAVVMVHLVAEAEAIGSGQGLQYLFATLILTGIIQMSAGFLKLGKFIRYTSPSNDGFCEWFGHRDLYVSVGYVQRCRSMAYGYAIIYHARPYPFDHGYRFSYPD